MYRTIELGMSMEVRSEKRKLGLRGSNGVLEGDAVESLLRAGGFSSRDEVLVRIVVTDDISEEELDDDNVIDFKSS